jgi:hypothetical protein
LKIRDWTLEKVIVSGGVEGTEIGLVRRVVRKLSRRVEMSDGVEPVWYGHLSGPASEQYWEKVEKTLSVSCKLALQDAEK